MPRYNCHDWSIRGKTARRLFAKTMRNAYPGPKLGAGELEAMRQKTDEQFPGFGKIKPYKIKGVPKFDRNDKCEKKQRRCMNQKCRCVLRIGNKKDFCAPCQSRNLKENGLL